MTFQNPIALLALLLVPALLGLYWLAQRRRQRYAVRFTNLALLGQVAPRRPGARRHIPAALLLVALAGLLVSFAGPHARFSVPKDRASVMMVIDVSGSMSVADIQPSRIEAAKQAAQSLVNSLPSGASIGLVAFSSRADLLTPLGTDRQQLLPAISSLTPGGGTALGDGLMLALDQLEAASSQSSQPTPSLIVLLTDGAANRGVPPDQAGARAAQDHIAIEAVGIGSRNGGGQVQGVDVGPVDEQALQALANQTSGHYYFASDAGNLSKIYASLGSRFGFKLENVDLTIPVAAFGTAILVLAGLLSLRWFRLFP